MRKQIGALVILAICIAGILVASIRRVPDPVSQGRPLSSWLMELHPAFSGRPFNQAQSFSGRRLNQLQYEAAQSAIREMGTSAVPHLIGMIRCRDSRLRLKFVQLASKQKWINFKFRPPANRIQFLGILGIKVLGPAAKEAFPDLVPLLKSDDYAVRAVAADALGLIGGDARPAIPALLVMLEDQDAYVRRCACEALGVFGALAKEIVPALEKHLKDPAPEMRSTALASLISLTTNKSERLPEIIKQLADENPDVRGRALTYAAGLGAEAKPAVPIISHLLSDTSAGIRLAATNALFQIAGIEEATRSAKNEDSMTLNLSVPFGVVMELYGRIAGKRVRIATEAQPMINNPVRIKTYVMVPKDVALKLIEEEVLKQLGIVIKHSDGDTVVAQMSGAQR